VDRAIAASTDRAVAGLGNRRSFRAKCGPPTILGQIGHCILIETARAKHLAMQRAQLGVERMMPPCNGVPCREHESVGYEPSKPLAGRSIETVSLSSSSEEILPFVPGNHEA
jgi:hypothetical protein